MTGSTTDKECSVWLFCGADEYALSTHARKKVEALCPPADRAFGLETLDGAVEKADEALAVLTTCYDGLRTVSFLGGRKTIWLKDVSFLGMMSKASSVDVKTALARLADLLKKGLPNGHSLVITSTEVYKNAAFYKAIKSVGVIKEFAVQKVGKKQDMQAYAQAEKGFKEAGLTISKPLLHEFVARTGMQGRQMAQDIEKLRSYFGEHGTVTEEVLDRLVVPTKEAMIYSISDAITHRDLEKSLTLLKRLYLQKASPVAIICMLEAHLSGMILVRSCLDKGWVQIVGSGYQESARWSLPPKMETYLDGLGTRDDPRKGHPYVALLKVKKAMNQNLRQLVWAREKTVQAHKKMLQIKVPPELLLELLIIEISGDQCVRR